jgi:multicomponent Na+:H+ antiporter subunit D
LFFVAGAIYVKAHKQNVSELNGLGKQMPMTFGAFAIGAMGVSGIPPICGFISKWYLCLGSLEANEIFFLFVFLTSAFLDAAFFFPIIYRAFFKDPREDVKPHFDEASMFMVIPLTATAAISLVLGIFPNALLPFLDIVNIAVKSIVGG